MKLITWNVNGLRAVERKGEIQKLERDEQPDFLFLQEIKGNREQFSPYLTEHDEYAQYYHSAEKKGYAGTGIWAKKAVLSSCRDVVFHTDIPQAPNMDEGRVSHLSLIPKGRRKTHDFLSIYFPNGGKSAQAWKEKLVFFDRVLAYMNTLKKKGHVVIVGGDMNVAHTALDIKRAKENDGKIGFHPKERAWMDRVMADGWYDVWRYFNPDVRDVYSYWDTFTRARERNVGWRIDYFFADKTIVQRTKKIVYLSNQHGSDHCPLLWLVR